ncbi:GGDEF domain-containing protein [Desulfosporosinus sp. PR]|uniref:GGDEF domain-containing protein n=1 Tax=Candidatus Desulfosporosinus nitrosoreducens TaxID=3401928 RepID=UPI0027F60D68|nr:GGDEF domain-containing protein [Desulfosporosinus sp. PR]MDQ7097096.1 GGDEF domain-containing protein [Desulfosporosinus sp. PR]
MPLVYYIQTSAIGLGITLILYFHIGRHDLYATLSQKIFRRLIFVNIILLMLEMLLNIFTGMNLLAARILLPAIVCIFYIANPLPEALWILYLDSIISKNEQKTSSWLGLVVALPLVFNSIMSIASLKGGFLFYIDAQNVYHRGAHYWLLPAICYSYLVYYIVIVLLKRKSVLKQERMALLYAAAPPLVFGMLQCLFFGISLLWVSLSFSLLIVYMNLQSSQVYIDHLTGLANRRKFDLLLLNFSMRRKNMGGIMIDIDSFKQINDTYGHKTGDIVLENMGIILKRSLRKEDFVARIGGDEFAVLLEADQLEQLESAVNRIQDGIKEFNSNSQHPFELRVSMGYDLWNLESEKNQEQFIKHIDQKMYAEKKSHA